MKRPYRSVSQKDIADNERHHSRRISDMDFNAAIKRSSSPHSHKRTRMVRTALRLLALLIFGGLAFLWVMIPTNTYKQIWQPRIRAKLNTSTYFGRQGANLLVFTFPVLFISLLGCVYLHLGKKLNDYRKERSKGERNHLAVWKQPMLVKGPLGVVSGIELVFFTMFIALLVWSLSTYLINNFAKITEKSAEDLNERVWEAKFKDTSLRLGLVGNICLALIFFPVARGSSILPLFGLTSEASIKYHIWLGNIMMVLFTSHGLGFISYWAVTNQAFKMLEWRKTGISNVAGELALLSGLVMWVTTIPRIRRKIFELFFYTHYLYTVFIVFFFFHVGMAYAGIMLPGFFLFLVDRVLRFLQSKQRTCLVCTRVLPCESLELIFAKTPGLQYTPTSIMFINVPSISKLQWHPYTITSNSNLEQEKISIIIKGEGSWSKKLYQVLSSPTPSNRIEVAVEGPYGPASTNFLGYDTIVMVSGGSGITPFFSIIRELIYMSTTFKCERLKVVLICAFKHSLDLTMLDLLLPLSSTTKYDMSNLEIQIEAYVTREAEPKTEISKTLRTIWFKPPPTDVPISAILGKNHWLWLGMVVASSFVMFLILMGIITRYYIYPIDLGTNKIFPYSLAALLNMLVICFSIAATSSAAVLWNKGGNAKEAKQIQSRFRAIWFKTPPTDVPVSAILGKKHGLWLGMIIASSFVMLLILIIGIITRHYIYPMDDESHRIFLSPLRPLLNMLVICFSIAATASAAVLWNKGGNAKDAKQIQSIEAPSLMRSPNSLTYNADKELESLPQQSLAKATTVHYGGRPDLKRMLLEFKGSVGVLVSGPKTMRHEVATICSSGLAENIHFESMSFSW